MDFATRIHFFRRAGMMCQRFIIKLGLKTSPWYTRAVRYFGGGELLTLRASSGKWAFFMLNKFQLATVHTHLGDAPIQALNMESPRDPAAAFGQALDRAGS